MSVTFAWAASICLIAGHQQVHVLDRLSSKDVESKTKYLQAHRHEGGALIFPPCQILHTQKCLFSWLSMLPDHPLSSFYMCADVFFSNNSWAMSFTWCYIHSPLVLFPWPPVFWIIRFSESGLTLRIPNKKMGKPTTLTLCCSRSWIWKALTLHSARTLDETFVTKTKPSDEIGEGAIIHRGISLCKKCPVLSPFPRQ